MQWQSPCSVRSKQNLLWLTISLLSVVNCLVCVQSCCPHLFSSSSKPPEATKKNSSERCGDSEIYYQETRKCYFFNETDYDSPCGNNMIFERTEEDPKRGRCDCEIQRRPFRPLLYHQRTKQCYSILSRGPCRSGQWIDLVNDAPKCTNNPCAGVTLPHLATDDADAKMTVDDVVMFNGACVRLKTPCQPTVPGKKSGPGEVQFVGNPYPECHPLSLRAIGAIESLRCPENTYRTLDGRGCQAPIDFDFGDY